jgi:hypothetical protein
MLSLVLSGTGITAPAAAQTPPPAAPPAKPAVPPPDDSLFEFLGSDDVGDARWWEYLRKSGQVPPAPPPAQPTPTQDAGSK